MKMSPYSKSKTKAETRGGEVESQAEKAQPQTAYAKKNHAPRVIPEKKSSKSNLRLRMLCQELLLARLQR